VSENESNQVSPELPEELRAQFAEVERRLWRKETTVAVSGAAVALLLSYTLLFVSDRFWDTPVALRVALTVAAAGVLAGFGIRWLRLWVWRRRDLKAFARVVQKHHRRLGDRLLGIVELAREGASSANMSPALREAAIRQVAKEAAAMDFKAAVSLAQATRWLIVALALSCLVAAPFAIVPQAGWSAFKRWVAPVSGAERFTFVELGRLPGKMIVPHGEEFTASVSLNYRSFWRPASVSGVIGEQTPILAAVAEGEARFEVPGQAVDGTFEIRAGDAKGALRIVPTHRPLVKDVEARIEFPDYLKYPRTTQTVQNASLAVLAGSRAVLSGAGNRELDSVVMTLADGRGQALAATAEGRFETGVLSLEEHAHLTFSIEDKLGLTNKAPYSLAIRQIQDFAPNVDLPELQSESAILESDIVDLTAVARDDYGVKDIGVEWELVSTPGETNRLVETGFHFDSSLPDETELRESFLFSPSVAGAPPESVVELRAYSTDYYPGRAKSLSMVYRLHVIGLVEHAEWTKQTFEDLFARLEELARSEEEVAAGARDLKNLPQSDMESEETSDEIGERADEQGENNRELDLIVREGANALKEAMRNPTFDEKTLEQWAGTLSQMKELSENEMSAAKQSLQQAQQQSSGEQREQELSEALESIEQALDKLAEIQERMDEGLDNLEALTLAQRLREAAKSERGIERTLLSMAPEIIGLEVNRLSQRYREAMQAASGEQIEVRDEAARLQAEIGRFFERTQRENYGEVAKEMEAEATAENLEVVSGLIARNTTMQSIENLAQWADRFDAWAKRIEPQPQESSGEGGEGEGGHSQDDLMQLLVAMIRMRAEQDNVRGRTAMLEEQKARDPGYEDRAAGLAAGQGTLNLKMGDVARNNPVEVLDSVMRETVESMETTLGLLEEPDTGVATADSQKRSIQLMTDIINLINEQSQQQNQQQQQSAQQQKEQEFLMEMAEQQPGQQPGQMPGAMPGMGPLEGDPTAPGGRAAGDGQGKGATARRVDRGAGGKGANRVIASEFREVMESYFKNVEATE